jgi:hypothetical protein
MARKPSPTDYPVSVPDVGTFTFGKRTMRDEVAIQVEFAKIIDGAPATEWLQAVGGWLSTLRVLTVRAPDGWDLDTLDPLDPETYARLNAVYEGLRTAEDSFRQGQRLAGA